MNPAASPGPGTRVPGATGRLRPVHFLVAANLVPLWGAVFWGWGVFDVAVIYWLENLVIGVFNVLRMLLCSAEGARSKLEEVVGKHAPEDAPQHAAAALEERLANEGWALVAVHHASKLFFIPFFVVHYGMFTLVHGVFVFALFSDIGRGPGGAGFEPEVAIPGLFATVWQGGAAWAALALVLSHGVSFVQHFLIGGEFRRTNLSQLMMAPYGRVVVLHIAILGGAFAVAMLGSPLPLLILLIGGKTMLDILLHVRSHRKLSRQP